MPAPEPHTVRRLTRAEYHEIGKTGIFDRDRVELIHGIVLRKPMIGGRHAYAVGKLAEVLLPQLLGRAQVRIQQPVAASDDSEPEPDAAVVAPGDYLDDHPAQAWLVIEVAESSLAYDRTEKAALYATMGVPEYWVVNLVDELFELHDAPVDGRYERTSVARRGQELVLKAFPDVRVPVSGILPPSR